MKPIQASMRLRPTRIAFLVKPTDLAAVRKFMRISSCLWGGRLNPIIPVTPRLPKRWKDRTKFKESGLTLAHAYLEYFEPDVFVESEPGLGKLLGYGDDKLDYSQDRCIPIDKLPNNSAGMNTEFSFGQNMFAVYKELYDTKYQFKRRHSAKFALIKSADSGTTAFFEATLGVFPTEKNYTYIRTAFDDVFTPHNFDATPENYEVILRNSYFTPLALTETKLDVHYREHYNPIVFIFDPNEPTDLIDYWNLRAIQKNVLAINVAWISNHAMYLRDMIKRSHRPLPNNKNGVMIYVTLEFASSISEDRAKKLVGEYFSGLQGHQQKFWYTNFWSTTTDDFLFRATKPEITVESKDVEIAVQNDMYSWIDTISPSFASKSASPGRWVNVLKLRPTAPESDLAVCFPLKRRHKDFPADHAHHGYLVSREGVTIMPTYQGERALMKWMKGSTAIADWLQTSGIRATQSEAGRIADEIINALGGLRGISRITNEKIIEKLNNMAGSIKPSRSATGELVEKEMPGSTESARSWESLLGKAVGQKPRRDTTLTTLTAANVLRLGLTVECSNCGKTNWYTLQELDYSLTCQRCLKQFLFPQGNYDFQNSPWRYRVIGPFSVPDYAMGGYSTTLALRLLALGSLVSDHKVTYATGMDLSIDREKDAEFDFAMWYQQDRILNESGTPVTIFGEAKSYAENAISARDIQRMARLGNRFPGCFLVFAVMKRRITSNEKKLLSKLALQGRKPQNSGDPSFSVIVLTGTELFADWDLKFTWEKLGGRYAEVLTQHHHNITRPDMLANLTQQIYLDLPDLSIWQHEYYHAKWKRKKSRAKESKKPLIT